MADKEAKAEPGKEEKKEEKNEVGQMKKGDYMIHVFIEQARQLKVPDGTTVDPMIEVSCMSVKKFTTAKDDIGATGLCSWNEHLFFEPKNVTIPDIEQAKISIRILDKGYFKDAVIGCYEFDVTYIYFMKDHALMHKWLALSNPNSEVFNEVAGYLKISITIAATGDEQIQITDDDGADKSDEAILMPPSIRPEFYQIKFRIFRAEKLPALDISLLGKGGSIDAYVTTTFMNKKLKTAVKLQKEGGYVDWDQEFLIPCQLPIMSSRIIMKLFDEDNVQDEIVGSLLFNLKECINEKNGKFFWKNIYGAPLKCSGENTNKMNEIPESASTWKGRILMQIVAEKTDKPQVICQDLKEEVKEMAAKYCEDREYEIIAEVGQGISLPAAEKYSVMIKVADFELKTEKANIQENNYNRWSHRFKQQTMKFAYLDEYDIGRVYVYLMSGSTPICFYQAEIAEFLDPNPQMRWVQLTGDLAQGKCKDAHKAGLLSVRISINNVARNGSRNFEKEFENWKKPVPKRLNVYKIRTYLFQCRDLPAADSDGQSDPYIIVWDQSKEPKKTKIIEDNLNPLFYQTFDLQIEAASVETIPPFLLDVYDWDMGPMGDDFIARCVVPFKESAFIIDDLATLGEEIKLQEKEKKEREKIAGSEQPPSDYLKSLYEQVEIVKAYPTQTKQKVPRPQWHPCRLKPSGPPSGELLVAFSIVPDDFQYKIPLNYVNLKEEVDFQEMTVSLNILGLRDLQSVGILPVKKAFIVFNIKSLVPPDEGSALDNIKTQPSAAGANPTINTLIEFKVGLPGDPLFCPRLSCTVHDYIFKGFSQPTIGAFIIPVGDLIHKLKKEREEETGAIEFIINELDKIMKDQGVLSYTAYQGSPMDQRSLNIQEETKGGFEEKSIKSLKNSVTEETKQKINTADKLAKAPLLLNYELFEEEKNMDDLIKTSPRNQPRTPVRRSPLASQMDKSQAGKTTKLKGQNALKMQANDKFTGGQKTKLLAEEKLEREKCKREMDDQRRREAEDLKRSGGGKDAVKNVLMPSYQLDTRLNVYREQNIPPSSLFIPLGWDENPEQKRKHYRRFYPDELENITEIMPVPTPFHSFDLKRGQSRGNKGSFFSFGAAKQDDSGAISTEQCVGKFKGIVTVQSNKDKLDYNERKQQLVHELKVKLNSLSLKKVGKPVELKLEKLDTMEGRQKFELSIDPLGIAHLQITKHLANLESDETLKRLLNSETKCIVRIYMISAYDLASRDNGGFSDPYLKMSCGAKMYNERAIYQLDEPNPTFNKYYDFEAKFPGCPPIVINVMDYDDIFSDDSIGTTSIDLEDRFFSIEWQSIKQKPIEYRQLYHPSSSVSQGVVKCWVEIHPTSIPADQIAPIYDISQKPDEEFEVRFVVFDTVDVIAMDVEGTSDVYCRAFFDSKKETHETDTHFRCSDGKASFNYRLVYRIKVSDTKKNNYVLTLQLYDRDFFKSNDIIGEVNIDFKQAIEDCRLSGRPLGINKKYYNDYMKDLPCKFTFKDDNSFYVEIMGMDAKKGKRVVTGKVRVQFDILPVGAAEQNKVGEARQEPNHSPFLPPPVGRISFTLNPLKMFNQMVGPAMRRKIYCFCCLGACLALLVMLAPLIVGNLISAVLNKALGLN